MKTIIIILTICFAFSLNAQNFTGKAIYKTSRKSNFKINNEKGVDDKMQEELRKRMQKMNQKTFTLEFNKTASIYKEEVKLDAPKPQVGGNQIVVMSFGGSGSGSVYYKNIQEKRYVNQTEIQGKRFLIKDSLPNYNWQLTSETKNIGNYTCYKAIYTREQESTSMSFINGETKEEKKTETIVTTAWYTQQVPISNGPDDYQGLPGLILEINDGKRMIVCTEIVLNPSEEINLQEPEKGKVVDQKKFDEIQEQKSKEMMEKFKSRNGFDMGNGVRVKIGG
ncbi:GLPGLI family protein [Polaribacter reichenbachii]|uniref:GLPGLI family protein n=1 Tax=Polaribacter reichenbachii TaxID=996801 RepID=A0A1B8U6W7_9FLAO|nr:GLPGLI family protein [Polaribacter reichenbachii]APZ46301.1 GLPGLI family protein [Polaribacter reichenbachii]AUC20164.1 GLPGLI family protein [Polaribacter reichenbachii]OBY67577.1 hypothetical protein LPB301_01175 [Polaribacter reichenbachii]